jgi:hypothetical protein
MRSTVASRRVNSTVGRLEPRPELHMTQFVGTWRLLKSDGDMDTGEGVTMMFTADGKLVYVVHQKGSDQIMNLTFRINENRLVTNQASQPREEETLFDFDSDGNLILDYGGSKTWFVRA